MKRKSEKIEELKSLLNGDKEKTDFLCVDTFDCPAGYYRHDGKIISEAELNELGKDFHNTIIFGLKGEKDLPGKKVINVLSSESAEKLKNYLTDETKQ